MKKLREQKIDSVIDSMIADCKDGKDITAYRVILKRTAEDLGEGDIINVKGDKALYTLTSDEIVRMVRLDPVILERALKRGKSVKRYRINENRRQPWEKKK